MQIEKYIPSTILKEKPLVDLLIYNIMEQSEAKIFKAYVKGFKAGKNSKKLYIPAMIFIVGFFVLNANYVYKQFFILILQ